MKKLLWVSNIGYNCSYNCVSINFINNFNNYIRQNKLSLEIYIFCTGIRIEKIDINNLSNNLSLPKQYIYGIPGINYVNKPTSDDIIYENNYFQGLFTINKIVDIINPNLIICLNDTEPIKRLYNVIEKKNIFVPYILLDCSNILTNWIEKYSKIITTTQFAKNEFNKILPNCEIYILPHIVNNQLYYKISDYDKRQIKIKYLGDKYNMFIIGSINANHVRKRWDILIEAFCKFRFNFPSILLIKTNDINKTIKNHSVHPFASYDFNNLIDKYCTKYHVNKDDIILLSGNYTDQEINEIYNCCDIGITATSGEGWGLTPMEMILSGSPQIIPNYSSFSEIFEGSLGLVDVKKYPINIGRNYKFVDKRPEDYDNIFCCLIKLYSSHINKIEYRYEPQISEGIDTIIISLNPVLIPNINIIKYFSNLEEGLKYYEEIMDEFEGRVQFLVSINLLDLIVWDKFRPIEKKNILQIISDGVYIREMSTLDEGYVGLTSVDALVNKLQIFCDDNIYKREQEYQLDLMKKYNPEIISEEMYKMVMKLMN